MTHTPAPGIRPAEPGDAAFITGMARRLAEVSGLPGLPREATDGFAADGCRQAVAAIGQPGHAVLIACTDAGEPLGFVHAQLDASAFTGETIGYVSVVAVSAAAAGGGIGRRLTCIGRGCKWFSGGLYRGELP